MPIQKPSEPIKKCLELSLAPTPAKKARTPRAILKTVLKASSKVSLPPAALPQANALIKPLELAMVDAVPFQYFTKQKDVEIFVISMRDLEYQLNKAKKHITDLVIVVPECYHEFLDIFLKKTSDKVSLHSKYNHKIKLLKKYKDHGQTALCEISKPQLEFVKKFLEEHLKKNFIEASKVPCSLPILLAKKPGQSIRFCVNYKKLNAFIKKDAYPIPLIAEILAQLKSAKIFTKINIRQAFHKLCMAVSPKNFTIMAMRFGAYK